MDAVLFDIDDTVYDQARPFAHAVHAVVGEVPGASDGDLYAASRRHSAAVFAAFGRGGRPTMACYARRMRETLADFGISITEAQAEEMQRAYMSRDAGAMSLSPAMSETLAWCAGRCPCGIGFVSNGVRARQLDKLHILGCDRWAGPEDVFVSDELGVAKPDRRIFGLACQKKGSRPARTLFVGDSYGNDVCGARGAGLGAIWLNRRGHAVPPEAVADPRIWMVSSEEGLLALIERLV